MGHAWVNSVIITVPATILPLTLGALAAFGFAWVPFPFRDTLFLIIVALMIVPIQTSLVPLLKLFADVGTPQQPLLRDLARTHRLRPAARGLPLA